MIGRAGVGSFGIRGFARDVLAVRAHGRINESQMGTDGHNLGEETGRTEGWGKGTGGRS